MIIKVLIDGEMFITKSNKDENAEKVANHHYQNANKLNSSILELNNGDFMVLRAEVMKRAVFFYQPEDGDKQ